MQTQTSSAAPAPLWQRLLGGAIGASIALGLYGVYSFAAPYVIQVLPASISAPRSKEVSYTDRDRKVKQDQIVELARELVRARLR